MQLTNRQYRYGSLDMEQPRCSPRTKKIIKIALITILILLVIVLILLFVGVPLVFMNSIDVQRLLMFTNFGESNNKKDYEVPEYRGLRNFYISYKDHVEGRNITLGVWHLLPEHLWNESMINFEKSLRNSNDSVIIHFHGSGETRKDSLFMFSRLYKFFHVISFDCRDYADSTSSPLSEDGAVRDARAIYNWVLNKTDNDIYVWAHSLGTALSTNAISVLKEANIVPTGLVLESPLTSMKEEIPHHPYGKIFAWLPYFDETILEPLDRNKFFFKTSSYILNVDCPIMILHSADDSIIPVELGRKLARIASTERNSTSQGKVLYHEFPANRRYDHFKIYKAIELPLLIGKFMYDCERFKDKRRALS